ncbi:prolyl-tRNA synthetase associated domain-containing protein [Burkholderia ambifaria]|uniref:prolyl-tRNA synthetase associated domain-containing protein n=1 Tax=Burkholderia ambifaria TaxID=152480 RepID=UPI001B91ADF1|nr:prolyl-tRNA synthetase associated domain-containing protein [Burkholderia ambifaria]MBR8255391.1 prolyl-tRNA synthetase associated domain-containing protein [Burkholderia ambifaria]
MLRKDELLKLLADRQIPFSCEQHDSVLNMAESGKLDLALEGVRCKNLLLQDKKGRYFLIVTTATKSLDLVALADLLGSKRLSFASSDKLLELLGVLPGSLSPFALVNDEAKRVRLIVDCGLHAEQLFLFHPLENNASVSLSKQALDAFLRTIGHRTDWTPLPDRTIA